MTDTRIDEKALERVARAINPGAWAVMDSALWETKKKYAGESVGWPSDQFQHKESMAIARAAITSYLAARAEAGFVEVPVEPTEEMFEAGHNQIYDRPYDATTNVDIGSIWDAMLAKAK